jgi:hypothetical protein
MNTLFNNDGVPLIGYGTRSFVVTKGGPKQAAAVKTEKTSVTEQIQIIEDKSQAGNFSVANWGVANNFPQEANTIIGRIGVLNTGLKFIRNFTLGQGIFPCEITGYNDDGSEVLKIVNDPELINFLQGRIVRRYLEKTPRDYLKFGCSVAQILFDEGGKKAIGINTLNALHTRFTMAKKGMIEKVIVSAKWPDTPSQGDFEAIDLLDEYDPILHLDTLKATGKLAKKSVSFAIRDAWSNAEYYSEPVWWSAHLAGWTEIARIVPLFLKKAYENQITWKWHIQIPYAFWDKKFPKEDFDTTAARKLAIENFMDDIETNLTSYENADKPIFTFYEMSPHGKAEEQWIITPLDNKHKEGDKLITSAAANSEILFSLMLNPNVLGAGMPGGTYAGNQGGSNIREAFLVNIANAWIDRQNILDPIEAMLHFNGYENIQLRFRSTILTTLDTGAGTTKKLS